MHGTTTNVGTESQLTNDMRAALVFAEARRNAEPQGQLEGQ